MKRKCRKTYCPAVLILIAACMAGLAGCRETPEENAVVSRADGLGQELIEEPLAEGETRIIELPDKWEETKKWNRERWIFHTDIKLESIETGNLPVVEMEQYSLTQEELEQLTAYFTDGQALYAPQPSTREEYQNKLDRLRNGEGIYSVYTIDTLMSDTVNRLRRGVELAKPENELTDQKVEVCFGPRQIDKVEKSVNEWPDEMFESFDAPLFFYADVGKERNGHISARKHDPDVGTSSMFEWMEGDTILYQKNDIDFYKSSHAQYADVSETDLKWEELLDRCVFMMTEENISMEEGRKHAEALLKDLGIENKTYAYSEPVLWFPGGSYEEAVALSYADSLWNADLNRAEPGYVYTFLNEIGGWPVDMRYGGRSLAMGLASPEQAGSDYYAPSMPIETILIAVTKSGIKMFSWTGMSKEVSTVTENVKLLPFEKMQERIMQYISYCFPNSQPVDDKTLFRYELEKLIFGYTYIPAYGNPDHAWTVPAWFLELKNFHNNPELSRVKEAEDGTWSYLTFNAMDGGVVETG